ncbi:hypothetical protein Kyoto34B_01800 [Helicobacter pylori]
MKPFSPLHSQLKSPQKKEGLKKRKALKETPLKEDLSVPSKQTHNSNTRYKACGIGVECLAKNSNWC